MPLHAHIRCPSCQGPLFPSALRCTPCDLTLSGSFQTNEFAQLGEEDLHFLRIFVVCEGRIREMESALGVSYPTIKTRLAALKQTLAAGTPEKGSVSHSAAGALPIATEHTEILKELEAGRLSFAQALARLQHLHGKE